MKRILKKSYKVIIGLIIGIMISATTAYVTAEIVLDSNKVSYTDNSGLGVDNVQAAIDGTCTNIDTRLTDIENNKQDKLSSNFSNMYYSTQLLTSIESGSDSYKNIRSVTLPAGKYIVTYNVTFGANATGIRTAGLTTDGDGSLEYGSSASMRIGASPSGYTNISNAWVFNLTSENTIYLVGYQTSGSTLSIVSSSLIATRIN